MKLRDRYLLGVGVSTVYIYMGWGIFSAVTDKREGAVMLNILP